jgi:hypothetical protein
LIRICIRAPAAKMKPLMTNRRSSVAAGPAKIQTARANQATANTRSR